MLDVDYLAYRVLQIVDLNIQRGEACVQLCRMSLE